jgi:hypothetical protein
VKHTLRILQRPPFCSNFPDFQFLFWARIPGPQSPHSPPNDRGTSSPIPSPTRPNLPSTSTFCSRHPINSLLQWNMHFLPLHNVNPTKIKVHHFFNPCQIHLYLLDYQYEEFQKSDSNNQKTIENVKIFKKNSYI